METLAVMDASTSRLVVRKVKIADEDSLRLLAKREGLSLNDCTWMGGPEVKLDIR